MDANKSIIPSSLIHLSSTILFDSDGEAKMLHFSNPEGKEWMVPLEGVRTGLLLYQPSGWKGHLLKKMLPLVGRCWWGRRLLHTTMTGKELKKEIKEVIAKAFGIKNFCYSIFFGTPCADQKVTIQVFRGNHVLGYCKVSDSEKTGKKFQQETDLLDEMNEKGVHNIPFGKACGQTDDGLYYFAQSTTKSLHSTYPHEWGDRQENFIRKLHQRTQISLPYEETDFCHTIEVLKQRMEWLSKEQQTIIEKAIGEIEQHYKEKTAEWSVYHGDFTPWNTFVDNGHLFVFDWEYALRSCPPLLDKYHWFTQTWIFEKHYGIEKILEEYHKKLANPNYFSYLCYLIVTIATYVGREEKPENVKNITLLDTWTGLIKRIIKG